MKSIAALRRAPRSIVDAHRDGLAVVHLVGEAAVAQPPITAAHASSALSCTVAHVGVHDWRARALRPHGSSSAIAARVGRAAAPAGRRCSGRRCAPARGRDAAARAARAPRSSPPSTSWKLSNSTPSSSIVRLNGGMEPGVMPPMSAWWAREATKKSGLAAAAKHRRDHRDVGQVDAAVGRARSARRRRPGLHPSPSRFAAMIVRTLSPIEPRCTGMCGRVGDQGCRRASNTAQEKSSRFLDVDRVGGVLRGAGPICSAMAHEEVVEHSRACTGSTSVPRAEAAVRRVSTRSRIRLAAGVDRPRQPGSTVGRWRSLRSRRCTAGASMRGARGIEPVLRHTGARWCFPGMDPRPMRTGRGGRNRRGGPRSRSGTGASSAAGRALASTADRLRRRSPPGGLPRRE